MRIWLMLSAGLTGAFIAAAVLAAFDHDWIGTTVLAALAVPTYIVALRINKRMDNS